MSKRSNVLSLLPVAFLALSAQITPAWADAAESTSPTVKFDSCEKPQYPADALARKATGTVTVAMLVDEHGTVLKSTIKKTSSHADLDEAAREAIARCQFVPGSKNGKAVTTWAHVQYVWQL